MTEADQINEESPSPGMMVEEEVEGGDEKAPTVVLLTLPDGGILRKRVIREGNYQSSPSEGQGCIITYKEKSLREGFGSHLGIHDDHHHHHHDNHDASSTSFAVEHEHVRVLLASSSSAATAASLHSGTSTAPNTLTLEPPKQDRSGFPPNFARPPPHLDALLRSMHPFERCAFTLSSPPPQTATTATTDDKDDTFATSSEAFAAAGEVELHCVLGGVSQLASGGGGGAGGGVTVRVISRSTAAEDRYPPRVNADSRVRLMVKEAPDEGCCGGGGSRSGGGDGDEDEAEAVEDCVEFDVGDGTVMEGIETAAVAGAGDGNGLQEGDVALVTIRGEYTLPDVPADIPADLLPDDDDDDDGESTPVTSSSPGQMKRAASRLRENEDAPDRDDKNRHRDPLANEVFHLQVRVASVGTARKGKIAMSAAERVAWGAKLREMGTALFKAGRTRRAEAKYAAGADLFTVMAAESEFDPAAAEDNRAAAAAAVPLYNNLALCMFRRGAWREAEEACTECLDLAPGDVKASLRRAAARLELGRWEEAEADLARALAAQPHSRAVAGRGAGGGGGRLRCSPRASAFVVSSRSSGARHASGNFFSFVFAYCFVC